MKTEEEEKMQGIPFDSIWAEVRPTIAELESLRQVARQKSHNQASTQKDNQEVLDWWQKPTVEIYRSVALTMRDRMLQGARENLPHFVLLEVPLLVFRNPNIAIPAALVFVRELTEVLKHHEPLTALWHTQLFNEAPQLLRGMLTSYANELKEDGAYHLGFATSGFNDGGCATTVSAIASWC